MSKKKTHEEYIAQVNQINSNIEVLEKYNGNKEKILHKCKVCGNEWSVKPIHVIHNHGCPFCAKKQRPLTKMMTHSQYCERVKNINPNVVVLGVFEGVHKQIKVKCKICGNEWKPMAYTLLNKHKYNCKQCYNNKQRKDKNDFKRELEIKNPHVKLVGGYTNCYTKTIFSCEGCSKKCVWMTTPDIILDGRKSPTCTASKGELRIVDFLKSQNIVFIQEYIFRDCKNINYLPFDFYLPDYNICIEYDGEQHYSPIRFNGCSEDKAIESFNKTHFNDEIKNKYCIDNGITLIRIPFYNFNSIEDILLFEIERKVSND